MGNDWETECPRREDRKHCMHWYDDEPCCACGNDTKEGDMSTRCDEHDACLGGPCKNPYEDAIDRAEYTHGKRGQR